MMFDPARAYSTREIAKTLGVSTRTVLRWREQGKLMQPTVLTSATKRVPGAALNAWWANFVTPGVTPVGS